MNLNEAQSLNDFLSGHLVISKDRKIIYCNSYISKLSNLSPNELVTTSISQYITKASNIFIDSYIYPLLINESIVEEIQITWMDKTGKKTPVIVNIKLGEDGLSYWSLYVCETRDKLQSELLKANEKLEKQSQELFLLATTDPLTGLLNRRELQTQAKKTAHQANRSLSTYALLSIDVDFFKKINDTYGHQVGDKILVQLANTLTKDRRANDLVARVGGEEFVLVLPNVDEDNAYLISENLRKTIENQSMDEISITVSIGLVVSSTTTDIDFSTLLRLSDNALYDSKNQGRNRTSIATLKDFV